MNLLPGVQRITADSQVGTGIRPVRLFSVSLVSGSTASTLLLKNGTSSSADANEQVDGMSSQSITKNYAGGLLFPSGLYADADANISYATLSFTEEL